MIFRGSAIAKIVGYNTLEGTGEFQKLVPMWVFEEMVDGQKLTEIINTKHENVKYLPGIKLPENVVCSFSQKIQKVALYLFFFFFFNVINGCLHLSALVWHC